MKSNKKLLDLYTQIYNLVAFSDCVFSYDKINELDCDGEHEIKFMFDFSNPTHRKLYNELIIALLDPHA